MDKRTLFKLALVVAGMTEADFARSLGVSRAAVSQWWREVTTSSRIEREVDAFINRYLEVRENNVFRVRLRRKQAA